MNVFLLIVILGLCGGGFYEYTQFQQTAFTDQQRIGELSHKLDELNAENKQLSDSEAAASKAAIQAQQKISDLTTQLQTTQQQLADKEKAAQAAAAPTPAPAPEQPADPNNLGDLNTLDGKSYHQTEVLKIDGDGITVSHDGGAIIKLPFGILPPDLQSKYGFDPHKAADLSAAQLKYQEEAKKAGAGKEGDD